MKLIAKLRPLPRARCLDSSPLQGLDPSTMRFLQSTQKISFRKLKQKQKKAAWVTQTAGVLGRGRAGAECAKRSEKKIVKNRKKCFWKTSQIIFGGLSNRLKIKKTVTTKDKKSKKSWPEDRYGPSAVSRSRFALPLGGLMNVVFLCQSQKLKKSKTQN